MSRCSPFLFRPRFARPPFRAPFVCFADIFPANGEISPPGEGIWVRQSNTSINRNLRIRCRETLTREQSHDKIAKLYAGVVELADTLGSDGSAAGGGVKRPERVAAVGERGRRTDADESTGHRNRAYNAIT